MRASAGPYNPMSFYDSLKQRADLLGGNPATGQLSLSTNAPIQISQPAATSILRHVSHTSNSQLTDLLRSRITPPPEPQPPPQTPPAPIPEPELAPQPIEETKEETILEETKEDDEFFDIPEDEQQSEPEPEVEQQGPPLEVIDNTPTEAQQLIGMDNTTTPTSQRPIADISPPVHLEDIVGEKNRSCTSRRSFAIDTKSIESSKIHRSRRRRRKYK
jgi:outer membrane biosynthesis protein TonB